MRECAVDRRILFLARLHAEGDGERRRRQGARRMREHAFGASPRQGFRASLTAVISSVKMRVLRYLVVR